MRGLLQQPTKELSLQPDTVSRQRRLGHIIAVVSHKIIAYDKKINLHHWSLNLIKLTALRIERCRSAWLWLETSRGKKVAKKLKTTRMIHPDLLPGIWRISIWRMRKRKCVVGIRNELNIVSHCWYGPYLLWHRAAMSPLTRDHLTQPTLEMFDQSYILL